MALPTDLFDENWYLARNPDVAEALEAGQFSSALEHFNLYGKFEGRAPGPLFNPSEYLAANRDEKVFEDPLRFDVRRSPNPHVGFGGPGPHFCLGAHLARREITVMFRELFSRLPDIRATGEPALLSSSFIHGIKHLTATFTPTAPRR